MKNWTAVFDRSDVLMLVGLFSIVGGIGAYSKPAAFIVFGLFMVVLGMSEARKPKVTN